MKILELKPKRELKQSCTYCDTIYILEESDVKAKIDFVCGKINLRCNDFLGAWNCPGCGHVAGDWLYKLPWSWREPIKARSPGIDVEFEVLKKAENERESREFEVRLKAENEREALTYESKFDKLLKRFKLWK